MGGGRKPPAPPPPAQPAPDDAKLRSSATLFSRVAPAGSVFHRILDRYFVGEPDRKTLELIGHTAE